METLVSRALIIRLSLHPSPISETSAFNNIRAFSSRCAGLLPFLISASSCSRSSALNRTTYRFTEISFPAMIASSPIVAMKANHQFLSNWLKRPTRAIPAHRPEWRLRNDQREGGPLRRAIDPAPRGPPPADRAGAVHG